MPIEDSPAPHEPLTASRRTMLKGAAAAGVGAATAGVVADILFAGPASAAVSLAPRAPSPTWWPTSATSAPATSTSTSGPGR